MRRTTSAAGITARHFSAEVNVARRVDQMQQIVVALVLVYHAAGLGLDGDAALAFDVELVQDLLVAAGLDGARELEQAVAEGALAMVDVGNNAEVPKAINWDIGDALLEIGLESIGLGAAGEGGGEGAQRWRGKELGGATSERALKRPPKAFSGPEA